ncbi:MAG: DUF721 domain-containing protein [Proteobacteria bacterium]|nr:DUF721 domain-containing protein [Pseudomonadota bacterium]
MKPVNQYINRIGTLDQLRRSTHLIDSLTRHIRSVLPDESANHVAGCALRAETVVVFCDSAAWAAQLRYSQQAILGACRAVIPNRIEHVRFKILPSETPAEKPPAPKLTENSRRIVEQAAGSVADDALAEALRRLSSNTPDHDPD